MTVPNTGPLPASSIPMIISTPIMEMMMMIIIIIIIIFIIFFHKTDKNDIHDDCDLNL